MFEEVQQQIVKLVEQWESRLAGLSEKTVSERRNVQNRSIRRIVGHLVDSASNNTHRIVHLQYGENPLVFPDYANFGNNDRWIAIQDYDTENWDVLVGLWKFTNLHIAHVIGRIDLEKLDNVWIAALGDRVSLRDMATDYPRHLKLHLDQIEELLREY